MGHRTVGVVDPVAMATGRVGRRMEVPTAMVRLGMVAPLPVEVALRAENRRLEAPPRNRQECRRLFGFSVGRLLSRVWCYLLVAPINKPFVP